MAKRLRPIEEVESAISARILAGEELMAQAEIAESAGGHEDWLFLLAKWREETAAELGRLYEQSEQSDIKRNFTAVTETGEYLSPRFRFPHGKNSLELGLWRLRNLIRLLPLAVGESSEAIAPECLHREIYDQSAFPETFPKDQVLLSAGDVFGAKSKLFALLNDAKRRLDIVDSYMDEEILVFVRSLPDSLSIRLLTLDRKPIFRTLYEALRQSRGGIEARQSAQFHDRFIVLDGQVVWHLGASLNGLGSKTSMLNRVSDGDEAARFIEEFELEWVDAQPLQST